MHLIFDLDQTLIDSSVAEAHRNRREWSTVYTLIPQMSVYEGITELIDYVRSTGGKIAVVTSSPGVYCGRVINHFGWAVDAQVGYHDTPQRKPHPAPILLALQKLGNPDPQSVYSLGDMARDIVASRAAGVRSIACTWGCGNHAELLASGADYIFHYPHEIVTHLKTVASQ
jgi:phosphoglycolate phosphatase-like HAD superfamily hydrolase